MSKVIIIVNAEVKESGRISPQSPVAAKMVTALSGAIQSDGVEVEVIASATLWTNYNKPAKKDANLIYCPLTIQLPHFFDFPAKSIYQACFDLKARRQWVADNLGFQTSNNHSCLGDVWLPIVLTAKGPIYGELIGEGAMPNSYMQPINISDRQRQPLYHLGYQLLKSINAIPSVYLLQCCLQKNKLIFDRLWPFPASPAIASLAIQKPDLFTCHWYCMSNQPVYDLTIIPNFP